MEYVTTVATMVLCERGTNPEECGAYGDGVS